METLVKTNTSLFPTIPSFFDDIVTRDLFNWSNDNTLPSVNIMETSDSYKLEVAAPGMNKNDFKVELDNGMLVISAERSTEQPKGQSDSYTRREFNYQNFTRSFSLPEKMVESDKISARYTDGILHITVPKTEEAKTKPVRQIKIA